MQQYETIREAALRRRCSEAHIRRLVAAGLLRSVRFGRLVRVVVDDELPNTAPTQAVRGGKLVQVRG